MLYQLAAIVGSNFKFLFVFCISLNYAMFVCRLQLTNSFPLSHLFRPLVLLHSNSRTSYDLYSTLLMLSLKKKNLSLLGPQMLAHMLMCLNFIP